MLLYLQTYFQPLVILFVGLIILIFVGYVNWYKNTKTEIVQWIARKLFRNSFRSEVSADNLFMTATSFLLAIGGIAIIIAFLYLTA